jgi:hypothetical protein
LKYTVIDCLLLKDTLTFHEQIEFKHATQK